MRDTGVAAFSQHELAYLADFSLKSRLLHVD